MQKRKIISLFLIATVLSYSTFAEAALQFLPRYQGGYGSRTQQGGKDKVCSASYQYICEGTGYAGGVGTSCNDLYTSCSCSANYKWSGGSCVLKNCSDYGYSASKDNTKSCEEKTPRSGLTCYVCTGCDSSTYKYACSGGLNAAEQDTANKCGTNYSECECVEHASWNSTSGKCECGSDYKAGTTSCTLKTCEDYGYSATEDTTKDCTKQTPRSGLTCWNCSDCTGTLYDCGSMANASGGDGTSCGGKYPQCTCKDLYRWDNGTCKLNCTRNSCSTTTYPLTAQNAANASSYEKCTPSCSDEAPRYKVSACASGYNVNASASGCDAAPVKTCEEVLTEAGYTLVKTDYEFFKYTEYGNKKYEPLVIMNDIRAGIEFDSSGNEIADGSVEHSVYNDILTPEYFHSEYPQCSGTPTITTYNYIWAFTNKTNPEINLYPNFYLAQGSSGSGWLYVDYEGSMDSGKVIFHGNIDSESLNGIVSAEPIVAEFRGNTVNSQSMNMWQVILSSGTHYNIVEWDNYQVQTLTMESGAKLSAKVKNNNMYFWYTVIASEKTTYVSDDSGWMQVLPNGCSSGSGTVTTDYQNTKGVCIGKLSYMCETAASGESKRNGSETETDLEYCRGKAVDCGTESCSTVANRSGKLVTDASQLSSTGNINGYIYLGKSITVSSDLNLDNAIIRNAADAFDECKCDNTIEKDPTLTVTGTVKVVSGSRPIGIETKANFTTVKNGGLTFSRDATIKTLNVSVGYWSGDPGYVNIRLANSLTLKINEVQILAGEHAGSSEHLNFYYEADNANVVIDKAICMWKEQSGGKAPCYINATYDMKSDGNGYANNGTIKYCPIQYGSVSSSEMAQNIWINGYNADEISGKSYYGYPSDSYPAASLTCSY